MKLLTLNLHGWREEDTRGKIKYLAEKIVEKGYDVIAFQEANQFEESEVVDGDKLKKLNCCDVGVEPKVKMDNYILILIEELKLRNATYNWAWLPTHRSFKVLDEGLAVLCKGDILEVEHKVVSYIDDYSTSQTRKVLGVKTLVDGDVKWFYSVHFSRFGKGFEVQWNNFDKLVKGKSEEVYVMGDFNNSSKVEGEGYSLVTEISGFKDVYLLAEEKDDGYTMKGDIDGWKELGEERQRIDYVFVNREKVVKSVRVVFDGKGEEVVSDHFGVGVEM